MFVMILAAIDRYCEIRLPLVLENMVLIAWEKKLYAMHSRFADSGELSLVLTFSPTKVRWVNKNIPFGDGNVSIQHLILSLSSDLHFTPHLAAFDSSTR